jgi:multidrug transporter EmrE-like cation transporter
LVSYFIFGEKSSKIEILGMVLVVSGILILLMFTK